MAFQLVQILYWLALATWFGGVLFVALAARIIFQTVRDHKPVLPMVLSVNLEDQHASLLSGAIVGNLLDLVRRLEAMCAAVLLVTLVLQWFVSDVGTWERLISAIVRDALFVGAVVLAVYDWRGLWPKIWRYRQEYIDHADEPEIANPAKEQFDRYHRESVTILSILLGALLGLILFSATIVPAF